ncbi:hypothetical protein LXA43DRAFT_1101125 [Ganoderma leucocontextum]|nr:hypothetical protein LXA43DRAFT_1101125 [Ganoderma leucocontextum]
MSHNNPNDTHFGPYRVADSEDRWNIPDYHAPLSTPAPQPGREVPEYAQPSLAVPWASSVLSLPSPFNPPEPEDQDPSQGPHYHASNFLATAAHPWWEYLFQPPVGTDPLGMGYAAPSTNDYHTPSRSMLPPSVASAPAAASKTKSSVTRGAPRLTAAGAPRPSIPMALEEITLPRELLVLSSCDFGSTLTLGDALKKHLSQISGDSSSRAFPSHTCAAKLAFWLEFDLGSDFGSRRKQVTVGATRKSVIEQPSKARLAHLVAREMEKYLNECKLRHKPFPYSLDDIVLRRIDLASRGTLRPRLYVNVGRPRSVRSTSMATC